MYLRAHLPPALIAAALAAVTRHAQATQVVTIQARIEPEAPRVHYCNPDRHREPWRRVKKSGRRA